jgi:hypothetical protein
MSPSWEQNVLLAILSQLSNSSQQGRIADCVGIEPGLVNQGQFVEEHFDLRTKYKKKLM